MATARRVDRLGEVKWLATSQLFYADRRAFSGPVPVQCGFDAALACGIDVEGISSVENFF